MSDDFLSDLMAEVDAAVEKSKLRANRDNLKKQVNTKTLSPQTRAKALAEFRELDAILQAEEWAVVATVALFTEQQCNGCGSVHRVFLQFMEKHCLVRKPSTLRWVRTPKPQFGIPTETLIQPHVTSICPDCCIDHGFALDSASHLAPHDFPAATSATYSQEDINAPSA